MNKLSLKQNKSIISDRHTT